MRDKSQVVLPLDLGICIDKNDFVFTLAEICESLNYNGLFERYVRAWRKLNPITLFEIILFAYMERKFSSHQIVKCCRTDIRFMWLLNGEPAPSVATVKRFLSEKLTDVIEDLFYQFVEKLHEMGEVKYQNLFVDGTKIEANANKYNCNDINTQKPRVTDRLLWAFFKGQYKTSILICPFASVMMTVSPSSAMVAVPVPEVIFTERMIAASG